MSDGYERLGDRTDSYMEKQAGKLADHPKWYVGSRLALIVGVLLAISAIGGIANYALNWELLPWQGKMQARQIIQGDGNYRIVAYDSFFNQCAAVQTLDSNIGVQQSLLGQFKKGSADYNRTLTNIAGQESARADLVNQYNADATKSYTIGQFKSSHLPYQLPTAYQKGVTIRCAS